MSESSSSFRSLFWFAFRSSDTGNISAGIYNDKSIVYLFRKIVESFFRAVETTHRRFIPSVLLRDDRFQLLNLSESTVTGFLGTVWVVSLDIAQYFGISSLRSTSGGEPARITDSGYLLHFYQQKRSLRFLW